MLLPPGFAVGPYEVLAPLGSGGMGDVYRARDPRLGRDVAIKLVAGDEARDPARRARFEQEARAFGSARAPGRSPQVLTVGLSDVTQTFAFPGALFALDDWSRDGAWMVYHDANIPVLYARRTTTNAEPIVVARALTGTIDQAQVGGCLEEIFRPAGEVPRLEIRATAS